MQPPLQAKVCFTLQSALHFKDHSIGIKILKSRNENYKLKDGPVVHFSFEIFQKVLVSILDACSVTVDKVIVKTVKIADFMVTLHSQMIISLLH